MLVHKSFGAKKVMSEISEIMEVDNNIAALKSPLGTVDEFFDAEDGGKFFKMFSCTYFCYSTFAVAVLSLIRLF